MARTAVPVRRVNRFQLTGFTSGEAANGNTVDGMTMVNNGSTVLVVNSSSGANQTITISIPETLDFSAVSPVVVQIPTGTFLGMIGPFPVDIYGNALEFAASSALLEFAGFSLL